MITILLITPFCEARDVEERRVEEEKRSELRGTEAHYYESPQTEITPQSTYDYFDILEKKKIATFEDAVIVMNVMLSGGDLSKEVATQKDILLEYDIFSSRKLSKFKNDQPLKRGLLAYMLFKVMDVKGGLTLRIFGPSQRYAHKELSYLGVMVGGSATEYVSGRELAYSFIKVTEYLSETSEEEE